MLVSKSIVSLFAAAVAGAAAALAWQVHAHSTLPSTVSREPAAAEVQKLEQQVATQTQRLAEAEARLSTLLKTANTPRVARARPAGAAGANVGVATAATAGTPAGDGPIDTNEVARVAVEKGRVWMKEGKLQEALDLYLAAYREVRPVRPGSPACQRLTSEMKYLGRTHPPALAAIAQLRDDAMRELPTQPARRPELSLEIALLNDRLDQGDRTLALFDALPPGDVQRSSLAMVARDAFIQARRYEDAILGKPFGQMINLIDASTPHLAAEKDPARQGMIRKAMIDQTATNIEVLAGAGRAGEAQQLTEKLLAFDHSAPTRALVDRHRARAEGRNP